MARRVEVTRKAAIEDLVKRASEPDFFLVRSHFLVHDRPGGSQPCACCGATTCTVVEDVPGPELLIDTTSGTRWLRHEMFR